MTQSLLFDHVDQVALDRVAEAIATAMMTGAREAMERLACDDTIPPDAFTAGLCKAHLNGAAAILFAGSTSAHTDEIDASDAAEYIAETIAELRARVARTAFTTPTAENDR